MKSTLPALVPALLIVKAHGRRKAGPDAVITADNVAEFTPSPDEATRARRAAEALGFTTGEMTGIAFSITAAPEVFASGLGHQIVTAGKGLAFRMPARRTATELRDADLPVSLRAVADAIVLCEPPDFGPGAMM